MENRLIRPANLLRPLQTSSFIFLVYLILPYIFFTGGINVLRIPLAPGDGSIFGLPTKIFTSDLHLWNPYIQAGTFPIKDIGWQSLYLPGIVVMKIFPNPFGYNVLLLAHYSMAGFFTFLFLKKLNQWSLAAFIGGITFMFCGFLSAHKGHHTIVMAASYLPIVLYCFEYFMLSKSITKLFAVALTFGLSILADYTAVTMYIGMVLFPYIIFRILSGNEFQSVSVQKKSILIIAVAFVIFIGGLLVAALEVIPILESLEYVTRETISYSFFSSYSFEYKLLPLLIFPYFFGTQAPSFYQPAYFGPWNLTEMAGYMGILPIIFSILAFFFFRRWNSQIYFWIFVALGAFLLVLGDSTPLYKLMYKIPIYSMFRASARNWLEVNFAVAVLSSFFVNYLKSERELKEKQYYAGVSWVIGSLYAIIIFTLLLARYLPISPEKKLLLLDTIQITSPNIYVPLVIIFFSTLLLYLLFRYREGPAIWVLIVATLFFDLFSFGHFHDTAGLFEYAIFEKRPNQTAEFLNASNKDKNQYRILTLGAAGDIEKQLNPNINMLYGFSVINGYSPIWLKDYQRLSGFEANGVPEKNMNFFPIRRSCHFSLPNTLSLLTMKLRVFYRPCLRILVLAAAG